MTVQQRYTLTHYLRTLSTGELLEAGAGTGAEDPSPEDIVSKLAVMFLEDTGEIPDTVRVHPVFAPSESGDENVLFETERGSMTMTVIHDPDIGRGVYIFSAKEHVRAF